MQKLNPISRLLKLCTLFIQIAFSSVVFLAFSLPAVADEYQLYQSMVLGTRPVQQAQFSADGKYLVSLGREQVLETWDGQTGRRLRVMATKGHDPLRILVHPNRPLVLTSGQDDTVQLWDLDQGVSVGTLRGHLADVRSLALNIEGSELVSGSEDGMLVLWDVHQRREEKRVIQAHESSIEALALHPSGQLLVSGDRDGVLKLWDFPSLEYRGELREHRGAIHVLRFNLLGDRLLSGSEDGAVIVWDWDREEIGFRLETGYPLRDLDLHPDAKTVVTASREPNLRFWNFRDGGALPTVIPLEAPARQVRFDPSGRKVVVALDNGVIQVWQIGDSAQLGQLRGHERPVTSLGFAGSPASLVSASLDKTLRIWDLDTQTELRSLDAGNHRIDAIVSEPAGNRFVTAGADGRILWWNPESSAPELELKGHEGKVNDLAFHPQQPWLVSGGSDQRWLIWDLRTNQILQSRQGHEDQITAVDFSPDGALLATGSADQTFRLWRSSDGALLSTVLAHQRSVMDLAFHPSQPIIASAGQDQEIKLWDIQDPQKPLLLHRLTGHTDQVHRIVFDGSGQYLVSFSQDRTVRMWSVEGGTPIRILSGEDTAITSGGISADGSLLAAGTLDGRISLLRVPAADTFSSAQAGTDATTENAKEETKELPGSDLSSAGMNLNLQEREAYLAPTIQMVRDPSQSLQEELNAILKRNSACQDASLLLDAAVRSIRHTPNDKAAWHALLRVGITRLDLPMIMLAALIGQDAEWHAAQYDYQDLIEIERNYQHWIQKILDPSFSRQGGALELTFRGCNGSQQTLRVPADLYSLRPPYEFLRLVREVPLLFEVRDFLGLEQPEFKRRMLAEVERVLGGAAPFPEVRPPRPAEKVTQAPDSGMLVLELDRFPTWRNAGEVAFELRRTGDGWRSYRTARDLIARLVLPTGTYSLRINGKIEQAFVLEANQEVTLRP